MKRHALFVGVDNYADPTIQNLVFPTEDATELASAFKLLLRFDRVEKLLDPEHADDILDVVGGMTKGLGPGDLFFFFFAGHGFRVKDNHVLVSAKDHWGDLEDEDAGLRVGRLKKKMRGPWNRMIVLDACQNDIRATRGADGGVTARDLRLIHEGDAAAQPGEGVQILVTSCSEGQKALEVADLKHGLFTSAFLESVKAFADGHRRLDPDLLKADLSGRMQRLANDYRLGGEQMPMFTIPANAAGVVLLDGTASVATATAVSSSVVVPAFVNCPICHSRNKVEETFTCPKCERKFLCKSHQDKQSLLCPDCAKELVAEIQGRLVAEQTLLMPWQKINSVLSELDSRIIEWAKQTTNEQRNGTPGESRQSQRPPAVATEPATPGGQGSRVASQPLAANGGWTRKTAVPKADTRKLSAGAKLRRMAMALGRAGRLVARFAAVFAIVTFFAWVWRPAMFEWVLGGGRGVVFASVMFVFGLVLSRFHRVLVILGELLARFAPLVTIAVVFVAVGEPTTFNWAQGDARTTLFAVAMFAMGFSLAGRDFAVLLKRPGAVFAGVIAQFAVMPLLAWMIARALSLSPEITTGLILVGCCPGGITSNILSFMGKGDVAYSIEMTAVSTILAPFVVPFLSIPLARADFSPDLSMAVVGVLFMTILPVLAGRALRALLGRTGGLPTCLRLVPGVVTTCLVCIVGGVAAENGAVFLETGAVVVFAIFLHNAGGYVLGRAVARCFRLPCRTLSFEVGVRNADMGLLFLTPYRGASPGGATPGAEMVVAAACVCHLISGVLLAGFYALKNAYREWVAT